MMPYLMAFPAVSVAFTTTQPTVRIHSSHVNTFTLPHRGNHLSSIPGIAPASLRTSAPRFASIDNHHEQHIVEATFTKTQTKTQTRKNHGIHPAIQQSFKSIQSTFSKHQQKAMTFLAAAIIMVSVLFTPQEAMAARSGGRMGGSFGGSSRPSSSRSYSSPSRSSYGRGLSNGYSQGYYSRPNIIVAPPIGSYGYGYGGYPGAGVSVVRTGPSIIDVIFFGAFAAVVLGSFSGPKGPRNFDDDVSTTSALGPGVTVAQISVALNVPNRNEPSSFLSFLDRLSATASTDSRVGVSDLVSQVAVELLRQKRSIFAADTEYKHFRDGDGAQRHFNSKAIQERSKFEKENTNKYGGVDYSGGDKMLPSDGFSPQATSAVVTLVISIDGDSTKLPQINSINDLEKALTRMATDVKLGDCLRSAEVLWTPDDKSDVISERDIVADYPKLRSV